MNKLAVISLGVLTAGYRVFLAFSTPPSEATTTDVFKDLVHVYMGALGLHAWSHSSWSRSLFWWLCAIEVIAAVCQRL